MEKINWKIPKISEDSINLSLEKGDRLFIVGANGSGKSALIQQFVSEHPRQNWIKRITAHRQTWFETGGISITSASREQQEQQNFKYDINYESRWKDFNPMWRLNAVLFDLIAKENRRARAITYQVDNQVHEKVKDIFVESLSPLTQINELFALGSLPVKINHNFDDWNILAKRSQGDAFSMAEMSDGERNAMILAAHVITADPGTVFLIDEPERHLHRSIIQPFLSALFDLRKEECTFIIATHEIALPITNPDARVLMLRSCQWRDSMCVGWDAELLEPNSQLPDELKRAIIGARKRILFVEGNSDTSLDYSLYEILFPGISVIPRGSCGEVEKTVEELRKLQEEHNIEAFGLIDRDHRLNKNVEKLNKMGIFTLEVYSVESLYYCSDAIASVAHQQANSKDLDANELIKSVMQKAFEVLKTNTKIAEEMAARKCEHQVRKTVLSKIPGWQAIRDNPNQTILGPIDPQPYSDELSSFNKLVDKEDWDQLIARYPLHKSPTFAEISKTLRCLNKNDYERMVRVQTQRDGELFKKLKQRISPLSGVLDSLEDLV